MLTVSVSSLTYDELLEASLLQELCERNLSLPSKRAHRQSDCAYCEPNVSPMCERGLRANRPKLLLPVRL